MHTPRSRCSSVRQEVLYALRTHQLASLAEQVRYASRFEIRLQCSLVATALEHAGHITTVSRLATECNVDRRRLVEVWRSLPGVAPGRHLSQYLNLLLLLRAYELRKSTVSWWEAATELGVHVRRLRRIVVAVAGCGLRECRRDLPPEIYAAVAEPISGVLCV